MLIKNIDRIYISHYTKLVDRKKYLEENLSFIENEIVWLDFFDRENLTEDIINEYIWSGVTYSKDTTELPSGSVHNMTLGEIGDSIAHFYAFKEIIKDNLKNAIIFEDDIVLTDHFKNINKYMSNLPEDFDIIHIGDYNGFKPQELISPHKYFYREYKGKAGASYIVSNKFAKRVKDIKIRSVVDHFLDTLSPIIYWLEPSVVIQGTQSGVYKSCIR